MDRGRATGVNIAWLTDQHDRYLVVSCERKRQFAVDQAVAVTTASEKTVRIQRVLSEDRTELHLYCLCTNELSWDVDTLWHACTMRFDLESSAASSRNWACGRSAITGKIGGKGIWSPRCWPAGRYTGPALPLRAHRPTSIAAAPVL